MLTENHFFFFFTWGMLDVHITQILRKCNLPLIHKKVLLQLQNVSSEDLKKNARDSQQV